MTVSLRPLSSRLASRVLGRSLEGDAREVVELSPAVVRYRPPAIALPGEIDRVTSFFNLVPDKVLQHVTEGEELHPATRALRFEDALVADGCVYSPWALTVITREERRPVLTGDCEKVGEVQLCTTHCGSLYFADWVQSDTVLELLAEQRDIEPLSVATQTFGHEPGYRAHFRLEAPRRPKSVMRAASLWMIDDLGMTEDRVRRFETLRERVRDESAESPERLFIDRGDWGAPRGLGNREEVVAALAERGFEVIYPERMTVDEIRTALSNAKICVGVEGSALAHPTMLLPAGACIVALVPAYRFLTAMKWFTDAFGMRYGFVVGEQRGPDLFDVDIQRLHATLDLVERTL